MLLSARKIVSTLSLLLLASCVQQPGQGVGGGGGGGEGGGGGAGGDDDAHPCDKAGDCNECGQCAAGSETCAALLNACQQNPSCISIDECVTICGADLECRDQCFLFNPEGVQSWDAASRCLYCDVCASDCAGVRPC